MAKKVEMHNTVEAGYSIVSLIFFAGSMMKTERMVKAIPFSARLSRSSWLIISYKKATFLSASAMIGNSTAVDETSLISFTQSPCELRSLALYT